MTPRTFLISCALGMVLSVAAPAIQAQPGETALKSCVAYAKGELSRQDTIFEDLILDRDDTLLYERFGRKLGSQSVGAVLSGRGAIVLAGAPSVELEFVCLLASDKRALFFHWTPRTAAGAMRRCTRDPVSPKSAQKCVDALLALEEMGLTQVSALRFQESLAADEAAGNEEASNAYRAAASAWRAYRDAECARRAREIKPRSDADLARTSCMADLTRKRFEDVRDAR